jgi:hypothetical protein
VTRTPKQKMLSIYSVGGQGIASLKQLATVYRSKTRTT